MLLSSTRYGIRSGRGWDLVVKSHATFAVREHVLQLAFAIGQARHYGALVGLVEVDGQLLPGLMLQRRQRRA